MRRATRLGIALAVGVALRALPGVVPASAQEVVVPTEWVGDLRDLPGIPEWRLGGPVVEIPRRSPRVPPEARQESTLEGLDPLLARQASVAATLTVDGFGAPALSVAGQAFGGVNPPDTVGDVGPSHYVQAVNSNVGSRFVIYDKAGSAITAAILMDTLGSGACADGWGDPVILWDPLADRWLMVEFSRNDNYLCVYVSKSADPVAGGWWAYAFQAPQFPDYPKLAVWPGAYFLTTNENEPAIYALERDQMLAGEPAAKLRFPDTSFEPDLPGIDPLPQFGFNAVTPADLDGAELPPPGAPAVFVRHRDTELHGPGGQPVTDQIELWELSVDFEVPTASVLTGPLALSISEFSSDLCRSSNPYRCVPQPATAIKLDPLSEVVLHRLGYRRLGAFEQLVGNFVTDAGDFDDHHAVRWFELERRGGGSWQVRQEGTYAPDTIHRWMGSIASDKEGNLALGYNVSRAVAGQYVYPGLRYAGRRADQPVGTLPEGEHVARAGSSSSLSSRYGDYAAMAVDPADDCTFWFTGEYNPAGTWATRILAFRFDGCDAGLVFRDGFELGTTSRWIEALEEPAP